MAVIGARYAPKQVEERWYRQWQERGYFRADPASPKPPYCIVIPPPNVTGSLPMGHAPHNTIQHILIRWKRTGGRGASCGWERTRFTMDPGLSEAVREVFVRLWEEGLLYRGDYIVNWCPRCRTVLSALEVEHEERDAQLFYIKY